MSTSARKMAMWLDGIGWVTPFSISEPPEDGKDPDGAVVPVVPGCQRMCVDSVWYYVTTPANLGTLLQSAASGATPPAPTGTPQSSQVSLNPMAMMSQMLQSSMMMQMMQSMGMNPNMSTTEKAPLDLTQLSGPAAILGEKIKEAVLGGIQIWRTMKGSP